MKILIVDDKKDNLYLLETLLKGSGYEVVLAANGAEALEKLHAEDLDMIIADILMPVMDGFQLCRAVKEDDYLKHIPFVFYTATYKDEKDEEFALNLGAEKYIRKPVEPDEFIQLIQGVIRDVEKGKIMPRKPTIEEERNLFKLYSKRLINKLEDKMLELEREVTERKRTENILQVSHRFLEIAYRHTEMIPLLKAFVAEIRNLTNCAAAGIRILDDEGNIPYQAYEGFSQRFYELESPLSINSHQCMCINVIKGTADPKLPFYTEGGSFSMNGTTRFLATVSEEEKGQTRNVCNEFGYESVALVPIHFGSHILGLIHVADSRENMVPLDMVELLEGAAMQLGTAVQKVRAEEALRESEKKFRNIIESLPIGVHMYQLEPDGKLRFTGANPAADKILGVDNTQYIGKTIYEAFPKISETEIPERFRKIAEKGGSWKKEDIVYKDELIEGVFENYNFQTSPGKMVSFFIDITERKRAEEELRNSREQLRNLSAHLQSVREEERKSIARVIHDECSQELTALKMDISWLGNKLPKDQKSLLKKTKTMEKLVDITIQRRERCARN